MAQTIDLNRKANIKQKTAADLLPNAGLPVIAEYSADSSVGQTTIPLVGSLPFTIDTAAPENAFVFLDGRRLRYGAANDYIFGAVDGSGFSSQILLNSAITGTFNILVTKLGIKKEAEFQVDSRIQGIYDMGASMLQGAVDQSSLLTAVSGSPVGQQFRTFGIVNRASIPDLANDLQARMGVNRIMTQQAYELQGEFGSSGEKVFALPNDDKGQIRFVGNIASFDTSDGQYVALQTAGDFVEIVFYGTGLNMMTLSVASMPDVRVTVDGGAESANVLPAANSTVLRSRNYSSNVVYPLTNALTLGLHSVKVRCAASPFLDIFGFEILNESANVNVRPGTAFLSGKKITLSAASSVAYNSGTFDSVLQAGASAAFATTRGARVIEYLKSDGTKGKAAYLTNAAQANLTSADHTYEDVVRTYFFREFGAGRTDDFSTLEGSNSTRAFTLDDGTTTLVGGTVLVIDVGGQALVGGSGSATILLTFIGTGLDIVRADAGAAIDTHTVTVDGTGIGSLTAIGTANINRVTKLVSGLPYGMHTVKISRTTFASNAVGIKQFLVYGPKKPTLPSGAVELADYNVMADYVANSTAGAETSGTGILRKNAARESVFSGTWAYGAATATELGGRSINSSTTGDFIQYTFFGTGFEHRFSTDGGASSTWQYTVDGSTNVSGFTTSSYGGGVSSFTASTGTLVTAASAVTGNGVRVSGLTLGLHTVKLTKTAGTGNLYHVAWDLVTPVHAPKSVLPADAQNSLPVGSQGLSDSRKFSIIKSEDPKKFRAEALGVTVSPTTTSTSYVPLAEMQLTVPSKGGWFAILASVRISTPSNQGGNSKIFVNGNGIGIEVEASAGSSVLALHNPHMELVYLSAGVHRIEVQWRMNGAGTLTAATTLRNLVVVEL